MNVGDEDDGLVISLAPGGGISSMPRQLRLAASLFAGEDDGTVAIDLSPSAARDLADVVERGLAREAAAGALAIATAEALTCDFGDHDGNPRRSVRPVAPPRPAPSVPLTGDPAAAFKPPHRLRAGRAVFATPLGLGWVVMALMLLSLVSALF